MRRPLVAARRGFGLAELLISVIVITIGVLGLAMVSALASRQLNGAGMQERAAALAQARFEQFRGQACSSLTSPSSGSATTLGVTESWSIASGNSINTAVATLLLTDSVTYRTSRGVTGRRYVTMRKCP